ncbi:preprotein translocase subunit SecG [Christensenellaceae bacterium OttesenSCG-928-L17]|nr:preprotein translocase subunit SecG [Christensenellaceae bacterium OttesenSCG-928-L17]
MDTLRMVITIMLLIVSALLIVVVLMQKSKDSGLGAAFGGDSSSLSAKGQSASKEAKLRKLTIIFAVILGVFALVLVALPPV